MGEGLSTRPPPGADPDDEEGLFQKRASELLGTLFVLVKLALVHRMDNKAVLPAIERFRDALGRFQNDVVPEAAVQLVGEAVYINKKLVRADLNTWEKARFLKTFFSRMNVSEICFQDGVEDDSVREFLQAVREVSLNPAAVDDVKDRVFTGIQFRALDVSATARSDALIIPDNLRVLRAYGNIVVTLRDILQALRDQDAKVPLLPLRRAVQDFVRLPPHTRPLQLGVLSLEQYRGEVAGRLAHIGVITMLMVKRLGLRTAVVRDIGAAAVLACLGRGIKRELLFAEPDEVARAGGFAAGVRLLAPYSGRGRAVSLRVIAAIEQGSLAGRKTGHPLSRLVAVADRYDLWTQRPPRGPGMRPDMALHRLLDADDLDRAAARTLVSTLGLFPVGSTVKLSTGETAIVLDVSEDPKALMKPRVLIVADGEGRSVERRTIDLADLPVTVIGTVDPTEIDLNVGHFLFA